MKNKLIALIGLSVLSQSIVLAQEFNFNDGSITDTTGQVELVPFNIFGSGQLPPPASGTIEAVDGQLKLSASHLGMGTSFDPTILGTILGPTRIGVFNPTQYEDFKISVLVTELENLADTGNIPSVLIAARLTDIGPGTTKGYAIQLGPSTGSGRTITMAKIINENPVTFLHDDGTHKGGSFDFNEQSQYLITFTGVGSVLTATIDDLTTEDSRGMKFSVEDTEFSAGETGVVIATQLVFPEQSISASIDNFIVGPAPVLPEPPALKIEQSVTLTWPMIEGNFQLESSIISRGVWRLESVPVIEVDGFLQATVVMDEFNRYFRLSPIE